MSRTQHMRRYTPWPLSWPILYGDEEFVAKGTILNISAGEWRAEGPMPVHPGMRLSLWVWPPDKPQGFHVETATVLWVKGFEFALEVQDMDPIDREWLRQFLDRALGWWLIPESLQKQAA